MRARTLTGWLVAVALLLGVGHRHVHGQAPGTALTPREVIVAWLLAPTTEEASSFLITLTARHWALMRSLHAGDPKARLVLERMDLALTPGPVIAATGAKGRTRGRPVNGVTFFGGRVFSVTFDRDEIAATHAVVHVQADLGDDQPVPGTVELLREPAGWRIAAVDIGADIRHSFRDEPSAVSGIARRHLLTLAKAQASVRYAQAIGLLRVVQRAQETFADINGGFAAPLECLVAPRACLASYPADSPAPLPSSPSTQGYTPTFVNGAPPSAAELNQARAASRSLKTWAFVLTPTDASVAALSLCTDSTWRMCTFSGPASSASGGACPASCVNLQ